MMVVNVIFTNYRFEFFQRPCALVSENILKLQENHFFYATKP